MRILIIGGTGLISSAITRYLVERGDEVTLYNRGLRAADVPGGLKRILGDRTLYGEFEAPMVGAEPYDAVIDADLGFHYTIPFADGARRVIAWQEAHAGFESCDQKPCYDAIIAAWERLGAEMSGNLADIE